MTTLARSVEVSSCSTDDSNVMHSCCGARGRGGRAIDGLSWVRRDWFIRLLACGLNTGEASPKSQLGQQQVQLGQRLNRRTRCAEFHGATRRGVEHPRRHNDYDAGRNLDVNHFTVGSLFAVLTPHTAPVQRVPAVEDFHFLRDMCRMTR